VEYVFLFLFLLLFVCLFVFFMVTSYLVNLYRIFAEEAAVNRI